MIDFWAYRPCGACSALVPYATGCEHWRGAPGRISGGRTDEAVAAKRDRIRQKQRRERERAELAAFRRAMGVR